jgi:periodic tryptophan protein 1
MGNNSFHTTRSSLLTLHKDTSTNAAVRRAFASRVAPVEGEIKERLVGVEDDSSESDEEEGGAETGEGDAAGEEKGWESMDED